MNCKKCDSVLRPGKIRCSDCGTWNSGPQKVATPQKVVTGAEDDGTIVLAKVTSAEETRVHLAHWDPIWGGGIVATSTTLFGGTPGAGKSTMLLQIFDLYLHLNFKQEGLYVAAEECLPEVKLRADRIGMRHADRLRMVPAMQGVQNLSEIMRERKPGFIVLDSLQGLAPNDAAMQLELCKVVKEYAVLLESPIVIISHVNKGGDISGFNDLQHEVDTTMVLSVDEDTGLRRMEVNKNRFGPAQVAMLFKMTANGLSVTSDEDETDEDEEEDDEEGSTEEGIF